MCVCVSIVSTKSTSMDYRLRKRRTLMACAHASPGAIMVLWEDFARRAGGRESRGLSG